MLLVFPLCNVWQGQHWKPSEGSKGAGQKCQSTLFPNSATPVFVQFIYLQTKVRPGSFCDTHIGESF